MLFHDFADLDESTQYWFLLQTMYTMGLTHELISTNSSFGFVGLNKLIRKIHGIYNTYSFNLFLFVQGKLFNQYTCIEIDNWLDLMTEFSRYYAYITYVPQTIGFLPRYYRAPLLIGFGRGCPRKTKLKYN
jgi:hypothetical protein